MQNQRARNLFLARFLCETQTNLAHMIDPDDQSLPTKLTRQVQGAAPVTDGDAERYANRVGLPPNWFDRDNEALLRLTPSEYKLVNSVLSMVREQQGSS